GRSLRHRHRCRLQHDGTAEHLNGHGLTDCDPGCRLTDLVHVVDMVAVDLLDLVTRFEARLVGDAAQADGADHDAQGAADDLHPEPVCGWAVDTCRRLPT